MRVGRGGKRGKTSGRGTKGQNARAGHSKRPEMRDILKKLPKRRGYGKNRARTVRPQKEIASVNLAKLEASFNAGDIVSPITLLEKGFIETRAGYILPVKILGVGALSKALTVVDCNASAAAKAAIEAAGGSMTHGG